MNERTYHPADAWRMIVDEETEMECGGVRHSEEDKGVRAEGGERWQDSRKFLEAFEGKAFTRLVAQAFFPSA